MPQQKTVVVLTPGFPKDETETDCLPAVQNLIRSLAERNPRVRIEVIALQYPYKRYTYSWHRATVHAIGGRNKRFPFRLGSWFRAVREARRLIAKNDVVALHSLWLAECAYVGSWIARMSGIPHIATLHGQDAFAENPYLKHLPLEKMTVTAVSANAARTFSQSTGRTVDYVIPTGIDREALAPQNHEIARSIDILGVGSLTPLKNFKLFIEIVAKLQKDKPSLRTMILGEGPERTALEKQFKNAGLSGIVQLPGHVPREEVLNLMRQAKILLHTSGYEGQGYVFMEAQACGMRVVSFDVGYAGTGSGIYRCRSAEEMTSVILSLLAGATVGAVYDRPSRAAVDTIDDTAAAFEKIYGIR